MGKPTPTKPEPVWTFKSGRWRSKAWLEWVRTLPCQCEDPRCPLCTRTCNDRIVAAHLRYGPQVGMGIKPDDFLVYPLSNTIHEVFHREGQQSFGWQMERVIWVWREAIRQGILVVEDPKFSIPF